MSEVKSSKNARDQLSSVAFFSVARELSYKAISLLKKWKKPFLEEDESNENDPDSIDKPTQKVYVLTNENDLKVLDKTVLVDEYTKNEKEPDVLYKPVLVDDDGTNQEEPDVLDKPVVVFEEATIEKESEVIDTAVKTDSVVSEALGEEFEISWESIKNDKFESSKDIVGVSRSQEIDKFEAVPDKPDKCESDRRRVQLIIRRVRP